MLFFDALVTHPRRLGSYRALIALFLDFNFEPWNQSAIHFTLPWCASGFVEGKRKNTCSHGEKGIIFQKKALFSSLFLKIFSSLHSISLEDHIPIFYDLSIFTELFSFSFAFLMIVWFLWVYRLKNVNLSWILPAHVKDQRVRVNMLTLAPSRTVLCSLLTTYPSRAILGSSSTFFSLSFFFSFGGWGGLSYLITQVYISLLHYFLDGFRVWII